MPENEDFSGKTSTIRLDTWVFDKVIDFLHRDGQKVAEKERSIFFLHLLGLDTGMKLVQLKRDFHLLVFTYRFTIIHFTQLDMSINQTPSKFKQSLYFHSFSVSIVLSFSFTI